MRGGLDDALAKLARRDELRRRTSGETPAHPPAITELVEAIAAVVSRHPDLGVTVGAEGIGDPVLVHFFFAEGQVQVAVDTPPALEEESTARHADFEVDIEEATTESHRPMTPPAAAPGGETRRISREDQARFSQTPVGYAEAGAPQGNYYGEPSRADRHYGSFEGSYDAPLDPRGADPRNADPRSADPRSPDPRSPSSDPRFDHELGEGSRDLGARLRNLGMASRTQSGPAQGPAVPEYPPHPFAATPPPPVPPQRPAVPESVHRPTIPVPPPRPPAPSEQATRRIHAEQHRAPAEPSAAERMTQHVAPQHGAPQHVGPQQTAPQQRGASMPTPLPRPIPLQVERPEETELAARRLTAMLRSDPSLLNQATPPD